MPCWFCHYITQSSALSSCNCKCPTHWPSTQQTISDNTPTTLLRLSAYHAVRTAKFVARKQWIVCGSDDMFVRVYNYNTMDKVKSFEAHTDYIRSIAVHPTQPYLLTCSDDMLIKLWDWDKVTSSTAYCIQALDAPLHVTGISMTSVSRLPDTNIHDQT